MTVPAVAVECAPHRRYWRWGAVVTVALAVSITSFALGESGSVSTSISPPAGTPTGGAAAAVDTSIATTVTRANGHAQLDSGVVLARVEVAPVYAAALRVDVAWTDPYDATKALSNPHAQISVGLYHPLHTGPCLNSDSSETDAYVEVTDAGTGYCSKLDTGATGTANVSGSGKLLLSENLPSGYLLPSVPDGGSLSACASFSGAATDEANLAWCQPTGVVSGPGVLYLVASILTPGGNPPGQQTTIETLRFFIHGVAH